MVALPYRGALTKGFLRELKKIPEDARSRILRAVDEILTNPFSGVKLQGELKRAPRREVRVLVEASDPEDVKAVSKLEKSILEVWV